MKAVDDTLPNVIIIIIIIIIKSALLVLLSLCCLCHKLSGITRGKKPSGTQGRMYHTVLVDNNN